MIKNTEYEVLTENGFKDFYGIKKTVRKDNIQIFFKDGSNIIVTPEHKIKINNKFIKAKDIEIKNNIIDIKYNVKCSNNFYDLIEVQDGNHYITNNITSHNCAFIPENLWEAFRKSVFPTVSAGKNSRIFLFSTPKGMNHFKKMWDDAINGKSGFYPIFIPWNKIPGRDEAWKQAKIKELGNIQEWNQEFECVGPDTIITIKDKNAIIRNIKIKDLDKYYTYPNTLEIFTPSGFKSFLGYRIVKKDSIKIEFEDEVELICSKNHIIRNDFKDIKAKDLQVGNFIQTKNNIKKINSIKELGVKTLYDLIEVEDHYYYTNDIISHNCSFTGSEKTLLSKEGIESLEVKEPIEVIQDSLLQGLKIYYKPEEERNYIVGVDTNKYKGEKYDYTSFQILDVTSYPFKVVASYRESNITYLDFVPILYEALKMYSISSNPYLFVENNSGDGQSVADLLYEIYEYENIYAEKDDIFGFRTTQKSRKIGLANLKKLIENGYLEVNDYETINELYNFILYNGKFQAAKGQTDDAVMALVAALFFMQDEELFSVEDIKFIVKTDEDYEEELEYILDLGFFSDNQDDYII